MSDVLEQLSATLEQRKQADPEQSYVASLHARGLNKILEKVGEEAPEVIIAAKDAHGDVEETPAEPVADDEGATEESAEESMDGLAIGPVDARRLRQVLNCDETTARVAVSLLERADLLSRSFDIPQEVEIRLPRSLPAAANIPS